MEYLQQEDIERGLANGISWTVMYKRFYDGGWPVERTVTEPVRKRVKRDTEYDKYEKIAVENGIRKDTFYQRVKMRGWSYEKASSTPTMTLGESSILAQNGQRKYEDWVWEECKKNGIGKNTFMSRVSTYGWDVKRACTTKPINRGRGSAI